MAQMSWLFEMSGSNLLQTLHWNCPHLHWGPRCHTKYLLQEAVFPPWVTDKCLVVRISGAGSQSGSITSTEVTCGPGRGDTFVWPPGKEVWPMPPCLYYTLSFAFKSCSLSMPILDDLWSMPWRHTGLSQVCFHSFLISVLVGDDWST